MIDSIRLQYTGNGTRIIGAYAWTAQNHYTCTVDEISLAANLLTYPRPSFIIADDEPLLTTLSREQITAQVIEQATAAPAAAPPRKLTRRKKPLED